MNTDSIVALTSLAAVVISFISLGLTIALTVRQVFATALLSNLSTVSEIERMMVDHPSIVEFHGVALQDLEKAGVTSAELAYLLSSFTAAGMYYDLTKRRGFKSFPKDGYRYSMLRSERTRKAWPVLKGFMEPGQFVDAIDRTIREIETDEAAIRQPDLAART